MNKFALKIIPLLATLIFSVAISAEDVTADYLHSLNEPFFHELVLKEQGRSIGLHVRLPKEYDDTQTYPTVYLLDGGITFPLLAGYSQYLSLAEDIPPVIIVGLAYPGDNFQKGNQRGTDYTAPSSEREHYGGGPAFLNAFKTQIFPLIEGEYRSDPDKRIIFGQSLGGQLTLLAAQTTPNMFYGHIASNPALHRNLDFFLDAKPTGDTQVPQPKVFVSLAENDQQRFAVPARAWVDHWSRQPSKEFQLKTVKLPNQNHFSAAPAAFRRGMMWLLLPE